MGRTVASLGRLGWPLKAVIAVLVLGMLVLGLQALSGDPAYHARLRHAAGLKPGDEVRVAGIRVGKVLAVEPEGDQVDVAFALDQAPSDLGLTTDSTVEVKLLSILGQRFLALAPGASASLGDGDIIAVEHALDSYTIEEFWLETTPQVQELDLDQIQAAIDTLATDMQIEPTKLRDALDGIAGVSALATEREQQLDDLLASTRELTDLVLEQTDELDRILDNGTKVMTMVHQRRETLRVLLEDAHRFVTGMSALVRTTAPQLKPMLRDMRAVLEVFEENKATLEETMRLAGPTMRVFTNATGDGPWLGVNAPWAVLPDDVMCTITPEDCQ